jgi:heme/copper-type cytochrome/quinol oxidase subunit 2
MRPHLALPITEESSHEQREHDLTLHVFSIFAAMVGVCLTVIGMLRLVAVQTKAQTPDDDFLAANAVLFVVCYFLSF